MRNDQICRFVFGSSVDMTAAEETLILAKMAVESLYGAEAVRLDASARVDPAGRVCSIDTGNRVGRSLSQIFAGYLSREFGRDAFVLRRTDPRHDEPSESRHTTSSQDWLS